MALNLFERLKEAFRYTNPTDQKIKEKLPFIHLLGYEKSYGAKHPQDYAAMINSYKSWVYACAYKNATTVAKNKLCIYQPSYDNKKEKEELKKITKHPFLDLIKSVNPFSNQYELMTITQIFLELTGNAYWWMPKSSLGIPYMIWNIPSHWMRVVPSVDKFIEGYIMQVPGMGKFIPFEEDEIVHFKYPSPFDLYYGTGPTIAAMYGIDLNDEIKKWGINFFLNNAQPSGVLMTESTLTPDGYQRLKDHWNNKYRGSKNAGKIAILEQGLKYEQTGSNVRDAKFELVTREMRDEILAMFGVPASKLGLVEDVNRANADANDYTYQKETIYPKLVLIEEKLNEKVIPMYDNRIICKFDNPVPDDNEFRLREKQINIQSGITTIDEERIKEGLEPFNLPETSNPLIPFSLVPAGQPKESIQDPFKQEEDNDKEEKSLKKSKDNKWSVFVNATSPQERMMSGMMKRFFEDQHSEVMRNLNKYRSAGATINKDLAGLILFNMKDSNEKLKGMARSYVRNAYITGLELGMKDTGSTIDFNLFEPNILRAVDQRVNFFSEATNKTTVDLLRTELTEGLSNGESIDDIAKRLDKVFSYREDFSSKRTAQTEVIGATNDGQLRAYTEAGVKRKEWISARDEKVRDSHQIDGQIVDITQSFTTGAGTKLQYPGDRSSGAPAEEIINCRCTLLPVVR